jgi:hypothetical protein
MDRSTFFLLSILELVCLFLIVRTDATPQDVGMGIFCILLCISITIFGFYQNYKKTGRLII